MRLVLYYTFQLQNHNTHIKYSEGQVNCILKKLFRRLRQGPITVSWTHGISTLRASLLWGV